MPGGLTFKSEKSPNQDTHYLPGGLTFKSEKGTCLEQKVGVLAWLGAWGQKRRVSWLRLARGRNVGVLAWF